MIYIICIWHANQAHVQCCWVCTEHRQESAWLKLDATCVFGSQGDNKVKIFVFSVHVWKQHLFSGVLEIRWVNDISKTGEIFWVLILLDHKQLSLNYLLYLLTTKIN